MNNKVYLDNACTSIVNPEVLKAADHFTQLFASSTKSASDVTRECRSYLVTAREACAKLINCTPQEIALVECTSHALGIITDMIPLKKGDNVLVADLEYQASTICWDRKREDIGFEVREVKTKNGQLSLADFKKYFDNNTRALLLASVQEINGWRTNVKEIADFLKDKNCYLIIDGIQEVGAMQVDVQKMGADFYCAGGKKWIGNPFGKGFLYIRKDLIPKFKPDFYSYFKIQMDEKYPDYITYLETPTRNPFDKYTVPETAAKFENGGFDNYLGALGLTEAIKILLKLGPQNIETKIKKLNHHYQAGLAKLGIQSCSSTEDCHMSSIVSFNFGFKNNNIERERKLVKFLQERNIYISLRSSTGTGGIRTSMHYYNSITDIDTLLKGIEDFLAQGY